VTTEGRFLGFDGPEWLMMLSGIALALLLVSFY
jgi:hypothetical protein